MKTFKNLFDRIVSFDNLMLAAKKAQKGKRYKESTAIFNLNLENELIKIQEELLEMRYRHGGYRDFYINDPKMRLISAAPYRDRVVHHALCNVIEPMFDKTFIDDSYACRKGKGTHAAVDRYTEFSRKNRFVLKCDIKKYFQSIDIEILVAIISRKIKCQKTMWLIREIVNSHHDSSVNFYFPGDNLFTPFLRKKGIPLGNLTSQFFANIYLNGFDHFIKEKIGCKHYIRYVDDFVVFDNSKSNLHDVRAHIKKYLESLRVKLHERKCKVYRVEDGIGFLGYRIFPTHRLLKKANALRMRRKMKKMSIQYKNGHISLEKINQSITSWIGHAIHADTYHLRCRILGSVIFQRDGANSAPWRLVEQQQ